MRIFTATLGTETSTFSPLPTGMQGFAETLLWRPGEHPDFATEVTAPLWAARRRARSDGWTVIEGTCAFAQPAGRTSRAVYESLRDEILGQLRAALPVDIVALGLHGAMLAHGYPDCEADLLERVRGVVGRRTAIGALLDPHCHLTAAKLAAADVLVLFKEYPHTDYVERADELLRLLERTARGELRPRMAMAECGMIAAFVTTQPAMRAFVERMRALERDGSAVSVSFAHGFPAGDTENTGARVLVITNDASTEAERIALELADDVFAERDALASSFESFGDAFEGALAASRDASASGPIVIADAHDNPGAGDAGDGTQLLEALLQRKVQHACLAPLWDPIAVQFCEEAGEGARISLRIGGKCGPESGEPIDADVWVRRLVRDGYQTYHGARISLGATALVEIDGVSVVLNSVRQQTLAPDLFTNLGIDLAAMRLIAVKSVQQFRPAFEPLVRRVFVLRRRKPGARVYRHLRRPIWPLDADTPLPSRAAASTTAAASVGARAALDGGR